MRSLLSRCSDWVAVHPVLWGVGAAVVLVLLGFDLNLAPIVVIAVGAFISVMNILQARRRGYCPLPAEPASPRDEPRPNSRSGTVATDSSPSADLGTCAQPARTGGMGREQVRIRPSQSAR